MVDMHLEVDVIPVSDVERSKQFYGRLGWRLDDDVAPADGVRIVQFTPPGSGCSVTFGKGITSAAPGSAAGALVVSDIVAARQDLVERGIEASDMWHGAPFPPEARVKAPTPSAQATGLSSPSTIRMATRGLSRRSRRGVLAELSRICTESETSPYSNDWCLRIVSVSLSRPQKRDPPKPRRQTDSAAARSRSPSAHPTFEP